MVWTCSAIFYVIFVPRSRGGSCLQSNGCILVLVGLGFKVLLTLIVPSLAAWSRGTSSRKIDNTKTQNTSYEYLHVTHLFKTEEHLRI
jgi:hypothetical protein